MNRVVFLLCSLLILSTSLWAIATVSTVAGSGGQGSSDGAGTTASFYHPQGIAVDASGNIFVSDSWNNKIRKITPAGIVATFAGSSSPGNSDGTGTAASFNSIRAIAIDSNGSLYVADTNNSTIRKITSAGVVTTFAGSGIQGSSDGAGKAASFNMPRGITVDNKGNIFVADTGNSKIRKITPAGVVTTISGSGVQGNTDGTGTAVSFNRPYGIAADWDGGLYVADTYNHAIRKITKAGVVTTVAGSGSKGSIDGVGTAASFNFPEDIEVMQPLGYKIYVSDTGNNIIRQISDSGVASTLAGSGTQGNSNGDGISASFYYPQGIKLDNDGNLLVCDTYNNQIRKIAAPFTSGSSGTSTSNTDDWSPPPLANLVVADLKSGWNMISSPFKNMKIDKAVFESNGITVIWAFDPSINNYTSPSAIRPGVGYWGLANTNTTIRTQMYQSDTTVTLDSIVGSATLGRWNLLGTPVDTTRTQLKSRGVNAAVWWYDPIILNYSSVETVKAGSGFWYNATAVSLPSAAAGSLAGTSSTVSFSKPSKYACETAGGSWDSSNECYTDWNTAMKICTLPSSQEWLSMVASCSADVSGGKTSGTTAGVSSCLKNKGFVGNYNYWTLTQYDSSHAWNTGFNDIDGWYENVHEKLISHHVRCLNSGCASSDQRPGYEPGSMKDLQATPGESKSIEISGFCDPAGNTLAYSVSSNPSISGLTVSGTKLVIPSTSPAGTYVVTVTATNSIGSTTVSFELYIIGLPR